MSALRDRVEVVMRGDARVAGFRISEDDRRLEVAATPAADWVGSERAAAHAALSSRILEQWRMVYDRSYRWDKEVRPPNFDAWISGFTAQPIPVERMRIWLDDALAKMRGVPHARVLEIGCGVGLVLAALAPGGVAYDGIDLSEEAIASLGAWVVTQPALSHVRLARRAAHELDDLGLVAADLAVLNSVAQYFPDADYLARVLAGAMAKLVRGGAIFLGDLRAVALLPMRATCVAAARSKAGATAAEVRADAGAALGLARELAVDPDFLAALGTALPRLGAVRYSLKPEAADHELSGYRYDAILCLDAPRAPAAATMPAAPLAEVVARLEAERLEAVVVRGLANARLAQDVALARAINDAEQLTALAAVERALEVDADAIEPDDLAQAAATQGYEVELRFTPGSPEGRFDALLRRPGVVAGWPDPSPSAGAPTNDPIGKELAAKLRRDLQASLDAALGGRGLARVELTW